MKVEDAQIAAGKIMSRPVHTVREHTTLEEVAHLLLEHGIGGVPVVDEAGKVVGIVSRSDFEVREAALPFSAYRAPQLFGKWLTNEGLQAIYAAGRKLTARNIMSSPVITATEDEPLSEVVRRMLKNEVNRIPIVRHGIPVGMVSRRTLLELMVSKPPREAETPSTAPQPETGGTAREPETAEGA